MHEAEEQHETSRKATPLPLPQYPLLWCLRAIELLLATTLQPILVKAVQNSGVTDNEKRLGYYSGVLEGSVFALQAVSTIFWGQASDRYGRKPFLILGAVSLALSAALFGLARTFAALLFSRVLPGLLDANMAIVQSAAKESLDASNEARGFSLFSSAYAAAAIVGGFLAGQLADPAERIGGAFATDFWRSHPFALPCGCVAIISGVHAVATGLYLKETLGSRQHRHTKGEETFKSWLDLLRMRQVRIVLLAYGSATGIHGALEATLMLVLSSAKDAGGLAWSDSSRGTFFALAGGTAGILQGLVFPHLAKRFELRDIFRIGVCGFVLPFVGIAIASLAARSGLDALVSVMIGVIGLGICVAECTYPAIWLIVQAVAPNGSLGAVNGLAMSSLSLCRALGPVVASALFAFSETHGVSGASAVAVLFSCLIAFVAVVVVGWLEVDGHGSIEEESLLMHSRQ